MLGEKLLGTFLGILECRLRRVNRSYSFGFLFICWLLQLHLKSSHSMKIIRFKLP